MAQNVALKKPFAWSISRLENYELCPMKYDATTVSKTVKETQGEAMTWGQDVHKAVENLAKGNATELPWGMKHFHGLVDPIVKAPGTTLTEQKLAINRAFEPVDYFANDVWCRVVIDLAKVATPEAVLVDWKTGKEKDDTTPLAVMAAVMFCHDATLQRIRAAFVWLKDDNMTVEIFERSDLPGMWNGVLPRVEKLERATATHDFPARPNFLCRRYCPVTGCQFHGI